MADARQRCEALGRHGRCKRYALPGEQLCGPHARRANGAYSAELATRLITMLRAGNTARAAQRANGISHWTFDDWMARGARGEQPYAEFRARVDAARGEAEVRHVAQVARAAQEDWHAASWMLERRLRDEREPFDTAQLATIAADRARAEAHATLAQIGEPVALSEGAIERYAAAVAVVATLEAHWERDGRPAMTLGGATGSAEVPHPLPAQIALARREAAQLGAQLGLDPLSRMKLARHIGAGRPPGAASAADRASGPPRRRLRAVE